MARIHCRFILALGNAEVPPIRSEAPDSGNRRGWVATNARDEGFRGGKCAEVEARRIAPSGVGSEMRDGDSISAQLGWQLFNSRSVAAILDGGGEVFPTRNRIAMTEVST